MSVADIHPSVADLHAFALGTLADSSLAEVESHIADCRACQERAASASGDSLIELLRRVHANTTRHPETISETAHAETPSPVAADARAEALTHTAMGPHNDTGGATIDALHQELVQHERYRIVRLLGEGGMGSVYEAEHRVMQRAVALKVINSAFTSRPATVERFRREVRAAARLSHPNIVTTYDAEDAGATLFLVMEYVEGVTLGRLVKERGPLPIAEACAYVRQAALGLQHAHERGMVHRDVKPDNLIRTPEGQVKVLDFGLAALRGESGSDLTEENTVMGTPDYMAPEQAVDARSADIRADIYSLGCTLYYLLAGKVPYPAATTMSKILAHREQPLPSIREARPEVSPELARIVARLLAKKPEERYQTPAEVAATLAPFTEATSRPAKRESKRDWLAAAAVLFFGLFLAAGVVVYRIQTDRGELVITADGDDVEVHVKQGGILVEIMDTKTKKKITLHSGVYDLELKDGKGLKLNIEKATLTRGDTVLAKIERLPKPAPPVAAQKTPSAEAGPPISETKTPLTPPQPKVTEITLLRRVPIPGRWDYFTSTAVTDDGKFFAADILEGKDAANKEVAVFDGNTGKELYRVPGWYGQITTDAKRLVCTDNDSNVHIHELASGKKLHIIRIPAWFYGHTLLPGGRHGMAWTKGNINHLYDLHTGKIVHTWRGAAFGARTDDGRLMLVKPAGYPNYVAWDVQKDEPTSELAHLTKYPHAGHLFPGSKQALISIEGKNMVLDIADGKIAPFPDRSWPPSVRDAHAQLDIRINLIEDGNARYCTFDYLTGKETAAIQLPKGERFDRGDAINLSPRGRYACVETNKAVYLLRLGGPAAKKDG